MNWLKKRFVEMLDYSLADKSADELLIEVNVLGAAYEDEEERDMFYGRQLGEKGMFVSEEFTTAHEWKSWDTECISRAELIELRNLIAGHDVATAVCDAVGWVLFDVTGKVLEKWPEGWPAGVTEAWLKERGVKIGV